MGFLPLFTLLKMIEFLMLMKFKHTLIDRVGLWSTVNVNVKSCWIPKISEFNLCLSSGYRTLHTYVSSFQQHLLPLSLSLSQYDQFDHYSGM